MVIEFKVENQAQDKNLISPLTKKSADILQAQNLTIVADNGYDSANDVTQVYLNGMTPVVVGGDYEFLIETTPENAETITDYTEDIAHAVYLPDRNIFVCPMEHVLYPNSFNKSKHIARLSATVFINAPFQIVTEKNLKYNRQNSQQNKMIKNFIESVFRFGKTKKPCTKGKSIVKHFFEQ